MSDFDNSKAIRKGDIYEKYRGFGRNYLNRIMIDIIIKSRECSTKEAKDIKTLKPSEVEKIEAELA